VPGEYDLVSGSEIARVLGEEFAAALQDAPQGRWAGPLESAYGVHLVFVRERREGEVPPLADIREAVERAWLAARREEAGELFYEKLREGYEIRVAAPAADLPEAEARLTGGLP